MGFARINSRLHIIYSIERQAMNPTNINNISTRQSQPSQTYPVSYQKISAEHVEPSNQSNLKRLYTAQALTTTFGAFTVPTLLAPLLLPNHLQAMRFMMTGLVMADRKLQASPIYTPPENPIQSLIGNVLQLSPFVIAFGLNAKLNESYLNKPQTLGARFAVKIQQAWTQLAEKMPKAIANGMRRYPINATLAATAAQLSGCAIGNELSMRYHESRGATLQEAGEKNTFTERVKTYPVNYAHGASLFTVTALLASPLGQKMLTNLKLSKPLCAMAITTTAVTAAALVPNKQVSVTDFV
jgi:hypothetical protein